VSRIVALFVAGVEMVAFVIVAGLVKLALSAWPS
jgi:hypothetical protein